MDGQYKRKVLMFAYDYPPRGWSGVQRTVKFVRYLPEHDWEPIVVAPSDWYHSAPIDYSFSDEVVHAETIRTKAFNSEDVSCFGRLVWRVLKPILSPLGKNEEWLVEGLKWRMESFFFPDVGVTWLPFAVRGGLKAVRKYRPEVIYATAPPYSTLITAWIVAKISRLPLVIDLRDLWIDAPLRIINGRFKKRIDKLLEIIVLSGASAIVTTTQSGVALLTEKYPKKKGKIFTIYNGYDEKDFSGQAVVNKKENARIKLTISHVGSLYGDISPTPFLKGLATFLESKYSSQAGISVCFVGETSQFKGVFEAYEHLGVVDIEEAVDHPKALEIMKNSDVLLLLLADRHKKVIPGKVFEYFAAGHPILGVVPQDGEVAGLLQKAGNAWIVDVKDEEGIGRCLSEIFERWHSWQSLGMADKEFVRSFERKFLTGQLSEILTTVAGEGSHSR